MKEIELVAMLSELYEDNTPISFKTLMNTVINCDEISTILIESRFFNVSLEDYGDDYKAVCCHLMDDDLSYVANLWLFFVDYNNVIIFQYYSFHDRKYDIKHLPRFDEEDTVYNINRSSRQQPSEEIRNMIVRPNLKELVDSLDMHNIRLYDERLFE